MYLVLLGAPGSGKGTQGILIAEKLNLVHVATGNLLREAVATHTELGKEAGKFMEAGELVPDELVIATIWDRLSKPDAVKQGAILDGFPRNLSQARSLDKMLSTRGARVNGALFLDVPEPVLVSRLAKRLGCTECGALYHEERHPPKEPGICDKCGWGLSQRIDDRPATIRRRFQVYMDSTRPLLEYYRDQKALVHLDGQMPISEVTRTILESVGSSVG